MYIIGKKQWEDKYKIRKEDTEYKKYGGRVYTLKGLKSRIEHIVLYETGASFTIDNSFLNTDEKKGLEDLLNKTVTNAILKRESKISKI